MLSTLTALVLFCAQEPQKPQAQPHTSTDPYKCKACAPALAKAIAYLEKGMGSTDSYRQVLMGWVWLIEGKHPDDLKRVVNMCCNSFYKQGGFNGNWATGMAAIFLSEVYKRQPTAKIKEALQEILVYAAKNVEATGGWCHHLGFAAESGYNKIGGGVDLGIVTCMMFGAMLNMKACGLDVDDALFAKVQANLESLSDGQGICYGTDNKWGDIAMGRASWMWLGLHDPRYATLKLAKGVPNGLKARFKDTNKGHAYPPVHFHSVAMAMHLQGPEMYGKFFAHWADPLIALQKEDGSVELPHSENKPLQKEDKFYGGTASFALILLLQQPGAMENGIPKAKKQDSANVGGIYAKPEGKPTLGFRGNTFGGSLEVVKILEKGPSEEAGLEVGDLVIEFKGKKIEKSADLRAELDKCSPGQKVTVVVLRGGEKKSLSVKLGALPKEKPASEDDVETPTKKKDSDEEGELF